MKRVVLFVMLLPLLVFAPLVLFAQLLVAACTASTHVTAVGPGRGHLRLVHVRPELLIG